MLFAAAPPTGDRGGRARRIVYRFTMSAADGRSFLVEGTKELRDDLGPDLVDDSTTLFITIREGGERAHRFSGRGVLRLSASDLAHQVATIEATATHGELERAAARVRFAKIFGLNLLRAYANPFAGI